MNDYYQKLAKQECEHILNTVKITAMIGREAIESTNREIAERRRESDMLKHCITINPDTSRADDIDTFTRMCHDIVDIPHSPRALYESLADLMEITKDYGYPIEDRKLIISALDYVRTKGHLDNCTMNQLYCAIRSMRHQNADSRSRYHASATL